MADMLFWFVFGLLIMVGLFALVFLLSSMFERERRASIICGCILSGLLGLLVLFLILRDLDFFETKAGLVILWLLVGTSVPSSVILLWRSPPNPRALKGTVGYQVGEVLRFDERQQVFARNRSMPPDSRRVQAFYEEHPQWKEYDAQRRRRGGPLGIPGSLDSPGHEPNVSAMLSSFSVPMALGRPELFSPKPHPALSGRPLRLDPREAAMRVKGYARHLGADLAGITELNPMWVYSRRGEIFLENWQDWGREINLNHSHAVVFAMEMDHRMVRTAPHTPSVLESAVIYAKGAFIATQLASYIANMGYSATAHHLRHYDVLLVPLAVDAGLGEAGRFGYLITEALGPRVRLGAVTTDLPMAVDTPIDIGVEDFCTHCRKCARCCPSQSIPHGEPGEFNGTIRWKINEETCFDYWGRIGTDCNICMRVCPWSHPRTLPHRLIRKMVVRNSLARRVLSAADDLLYGRNPRPFDPPKWAAYR
jgi:reductive dehalogenase